MQEESTIKETQNEISSLIRNIIFYNLTNLGKKTVKTIKKLRYLLSVMHSLRNETVWEESRGTQF